MEMRLELYEKPETIRYYSADLLWEQKLYQELRFVLLEIIGIQSILVSTILELEPLFIIRLYSYRFQIECTLRELKQQIGAFCYYFWPKHMPKLSYYQKEEEPGPLEQAEKEWSRKNILKAVQAIEIYMVMSCMYRHGDPPKYFRLFDWKTDLRPTALSEDTIQRKGIRNSAHSAPAEIFFLYMEKQPE